MNLWAFVLLDVLQLRRAGCSPDQIDRLVTLRRRVQRGEISEFTLDTRRIRFVRWLVQHGRLSDDTPGPFRRSIRPLRASQAHGRDPQARR